jgi:hypothetical protein
MDHPVFDLAACKAGASDTLERGPMFVERAAPSFQYIREMARTAQASDKFKR